MRDSNGSSTTFPPVDGKKGWPWTEEVKPEIYSSKENWPKISIVTPSFNQGHFIEETIRSILLQNYPNLQYIIIDGGSSDKTLEIVRKYEPWISFWTSEKDQGQADAINKGVVHCDGEIFNWINSDDFLAAGALFKIANTFVPGTTIAGGVVDFYEDDGTFSKIVENKNLELEQFILLKSTFHQPGVWCDLQNFKSVEKLSNFSSYYFDRIFFIKYLRRYPRVTYIKDTLVHFRYHGSSKTVTIKNNGLEELISYYQILLTDPLFLNYKYQLQQALKYRLLTERQVNKLEIEKNQISKAKLIMKYFQLASRSPHYLGSFYFLVKFKKAVLGN